MSEKLAILRMLAIKDLYGYEISTNLRYIEVSDTYPGKPLQVTFGT